MSISGGKNAAVAILPAALLVDGTCRIENIPQISDVTLLFSIPLVGFICLIVFSFDNGNINRRNFARSYWCSLLLGIVLTVLLVFALFAFGFATELVESVQSVLPM